MGKITVYVGPMFSGKSHYLTAHFYPMRLAKNLKYAVFQPLKNVRDGVKVTSRTGLALPAIQIERLEEIPLGQYDFIGIDELHLFQKPKIAHLEALRQAGAELVICMLDLDYRGKLMPAFKQALELGPDQVIYLKAVCSVCGGYNQACFTQILNAKNQPVLSGLEVNQCEEKGGLLTYQARCSRCYIRS